MWYKSFKNWHNEKDVHKWDRIENLEINPYAKGQIIFDHGAQSIQ